MTKDIWHTTKEKPMLQRDVILCGDGWSMAIDIIPETVNNICWGNVEKWCYIDDLLALETELERTRKALDVAVDKLKGIKAYYDDSYADPHAFVNWHIVAQRLANDADDAIKAITALEKKD